MKSATRPRKPRRCRSKSAATSAVVKIDADTALTLAMRAAAAEMCDPRLTAWVEKLIQGDKPTT